MVVRAPFILALVVSLSARGADIIVEPAAPDTPLENLVQVVVPQARLAAVSEVLPTLAFTYRPSPADKPAAPGRLSIFGIDDKGHPVGTPAPPPPPAPAPAAGAPAPPKPAPLPPLPLFTVKLPRPASLAAYPAAATSLLFHPKLPLLYVWQDIAGPPMTSAKDNVVYREFDHLLVYSLAPNQAPKLELATARGPGFVYGTSAGTLSLDASARRMMLPNLRTLTSADNAAGTSVGYVKLDDKGMPVKDGDKLAIVIDDMPAYSAFPNGTGCVFASDSVCVFAGYYGPVTWDSENRRGRFCSYMMAGAASALRLVGHPKLPLVYMSMYGTPGVFSMEHADGYLTMQPKMLRIKGGAGVLTPPVFMPRHNKMALGASSRVYLVSVDAEGNFLPSVTQTLVRNPATEAIAYSEKFDRLYVAAENP
jgi:hypothetical protein